MCSCYFIKCSTFNWSNFPNLANSYSCFVVYCWHWRASLWDKHLPNIVVCFIKTVLLGYSKLLSSHFGGRLKTVAVIYMFICTFFSSVVAFYLFQCTSEHSGNLKKKKWEVVMNIAMMWPKIMTLNTESYI